MTKEQTQILEDYIKDVEAYWQAVSRKEEPSIDAIFYQNLKTVIELAQDFALDEDDMMELIQEGCVGLLEAIVAHEQGKKKPFSTLVENKITQHFLKYLQSTFLIKYPQRIVELVIKVHKFCGKEQLPMEEVKKALQITEYQWRLVESCKAIFMPLQEAKDLEAQDFTGISEIEDASYQEWLKTAVPLALKALPAKEERIIRARYLKDEGVQQYKSMVEECEMSSSNCWKKEKKITTRLRNYQAFKKMYEDGC